MQLMKGIHHPLTEPIARATVDLLRELLQARDPELKGILEILGWTWKDLETVLRNPAEVHLGKLLTALLTAIGTLRIEKFFLPGMEDTEVERDFTVPVPLTEKVEDMLVEDLLAAISEGSPPVQVLLSFCRRLALALLERGILEWQDVLDSHAKLKLSVEALKKQGRLALSVS